MPTQHNQFKSLAEYTTNKYYSRD